MSEFCLYFKSNKMKTVIKYTQDIVKSAIEINKLMKTCAFHSKKWLNIFDNRDYKKNHANLMNFLHPE